MLVSLGASRFGQRWLPYQSPRAPKKEMFLRGVSTNKSGKEAKGQLIEANGRILRLETYIQQGLQPRCEDLHVQLTDAVKTGWDCIDKQEKAIVTMCRQVACLEQDKLNLEKSTFLLSGALLPIKLKSPKYCTVRSIYFFA